MKKQTAAGTATRADRKTGGKTKPKRAAANKSETQQAMQPEGCRAMMRSKLAQGFPGIVDGFVEAAKKGGVPHMKLTTELLKPTDEERSQSQGTAERLLEGLKKLDL